MTRHDPGFFVSKKPNDCFRNKILLGDYVFQYNDIDTVYKTNGDKALVIFGFIVNSSVPSYTPQDILDYLFEFNCMEEVITKSKRMAGRFVIFLKIGKKITVLPDATCSIPVTYTISGELAISSNPKIIADFFGFTESKLAINIKKSAAEMHPLPNTLTMYDEIKQVIPNHYLCCEKRSCVRYYPIEREDTQTIDNAALKSVEIMTGIVEAYSRNKNLSIPITSGIDSRVVLASCRKYIGDIPLYTFVHEHFSHDTPDLYVPREMAQKLGLSYSQFKTQKPDDSIICFFEQKLGGNVNSYIMANAFTYNKSVLKEHTFLSGDIIPLAKSGFGLNAPEVLATVNYLVTKTHNYSKYNKFEVARWVQETKPYAKKTGISKFDLFFWEHRIGKWVSNNLMNYDLLCESLNIFNCRELIELWLAIPRSERVKHSIHKKIIEIYWPELLEFPINPGRKHSRVYKNWLLFYSGSIAKFYLSKRDVLNNY